MLVFIATHLFLTQELVEGGISNKFHEKYFWMWDAVSQRTKYFFGAGLQKGCNLPNTQNDTYEPS